MAVTNLLRENKGNPSFSSIFFFFNDKGITRGKVISQGHTASSQLIGCGSGTPIARLPAQCPFMTGSPRRPTLGPLGNLGSKPPEWCEFCPPLWVASWCEDAGRGRLRKLPGGRPPATGGILYRLSFPQSRWTPAQDLIAYLPQAA